MRTKHPRATSQRPRHSPQEHHEYFTVKGTVVGLERTRYTTSDSANFYRRLLKAQANDVLRALRLDDIEQPDLTRANLRLISARLDKALDRLTGTTPRDRALVWLDENLHELARERRRREADRVRRGKELIDNPDWQDAAPKSPLAPSVSEQAALNAEVGVNVRVGSSWGKALFELVGDEDNSFLAGVILRFPWHSGLITFELMGLAHAYCVSILRRPPRGRRRRGVSPPATRAECFRQLAVELNVVGSAVSASGLQATLRRAKQRLRPPFIAGSATLSGSATVVAAGTVKRRRK